MKVFLVGLLMFCTVMIFSGCATTTASDGKSATKINGYISTSAVKRF